VSEDAANQSEGKASPVKTDGDSGCERFSSVGRSPDSYTDGRKLWDWKTKYPPEACKEMRVEAGVLSLTFAVFLVLGGVALGLSGQSMTVPLGSSLLLNVDCRLLAIFFAGSVGATMFSIKWLIHSAAKGKWHLDRRYWRLFVPFLGGIYACVVITLLDSGVMGGQDAVTDRPLAISSAFAFLVGYFSDGVSGLLSNVANAVFGTLEKK
jgi:hypothetical protein